MRNDLGDAASRPGCSPSVEPASGLDGFATSPPIAEPHWRGDKLDAVLPVLHAIAADDFDRWTWCRNTRCKYIRLAIDTRNGGYVRIFDRDGAQITLEALEHQRRRKCADCGGSGVLETYGGHGNVLELPCVCPAGRKYAQGMEARRAETSEAQARSRSDDSPVAREGDAP